MQPAFLHQRTVDRATQRAMGQVGWKPTRAMRIQGGRLVKTWEGRATARAAKTPRRGMWMRKATRLMPGPTWTWRCPSMQVAQATTSETPVRSTEAAERMQWTVRVTRTFLSNRMPRSPRMEENRT
ncbi:MAG: hypothetical protein AMXMBFR64_37170 [Myxococcales bacterium]